MADSWNPTAPQSAPAGGTITKAFWDQEVRDRMEALLAGLRGDGSADADVFQAIKTGTLAARPAASAVTAGRQYRATDIKANFVADISQWEHAGGQGVFDSFDRANVEPMNAAESGHAWTEVGDIDIVTNAATPQAAGALMTVDTGAPLRTAHYALTFQVGNVAADLDVALILRYTDASNYLWVQAFGGAADGLRVNTTIAGASVNRESVNVSYNVSSIYKLNVFVRGATVDASVRLEPSTGGGSVEVSHATLATMYTPFATATRAGMKFGTAVGAGNQWVMDYYCIPNA